uniref:Uncharacterized protein n=1 Tax=Trypanosoma congolense (strain IL3000) TaxID=1068625 RepID=F9W9S7_TRYCI|nr:hypothetical protein, unlikely [Trypanosoma congolense IL3000]
MAGAVRGFPSTQRNDSAGALCRCGPRILPKSNDNEWGPPTVPKLQTYKRSLSITLLRGQYGPKTLGSLCFAHYFSYELRRPGKKSRVRTGWAGGPEWFRSKLSKRGKKLSLISRGSKAPSFSIRQTEGLKIITSQAVIHVVLLVSRC